MNELPEDYQKHVDIINNMCLVDIAHLLRFAPVGHPYMSSALPYWSLLNKRFQSLGGWTPQLSKQIGWG